MIEEEEVVSRRQRFVTFESWETVNLVAKDMYMTAGTCKDSSIHLQPTPPEIHRSMFSSFPGCNTRKKCFILVSCFIVQKPKEYLFYWYFILFPFLHSKEFYSWLYFLGPGSRFWSNNAFLSK